MGYCSEADWADRLTLGGALGANIHGRGLKFRPFIGDVEAITMDADGTLRNLQPYPEPRTLPPGDWRLWPIRRRHACGFA